MNEKYWFDKKMKMSEIYCKIHRIQLKFVRMEFGIQIYYCYKCNKEYCEFADISDIYWSNYEWLYEN